MVGRVAARAEIFVGGPGASAERRFLSQRVAEGAREGDTDSARLGRQQDTMRPGRDGWDCWSGRGWAWVGSRRLHEAVTKVARRCGGGDGYGPWQMAAGVPRRFGLARPRR